MLTKRIISCLDIDKGKVVKGTKFNCLKEVGDPVALARVYNNEGADELVILDISATNEKRKTTFSEISQIVKNVFIPITVGGGIKNTDDIQKLLDLGVDKVSLNTAAFKNMKLISAAANRFGSQSVVLSVDARKIRNSWKVCLNGGRELTNTGVEDWIRQGEKLGAGEVLLTSIDYDGTKTGFDLSLLKIISSKIGISLIASGGAGKVEDFCDVFKKTGADGALAAGIFHSGAYSIKKLKKILSDKRIPIRIS